MESTVAQKLENLLHLQNLDSKLDSILKIRGALPEEVQDLEDEIAGYQTRLDKYDSDIQSLEAGIKAHKEAIKESEKLIKKYEEQQMNVRNNREYDAITKEVELQGLEIQIAEKKIKEDHFKIDNKKAEVTILKETLDDRTKDLENKKAELNTIIAESETDEQKLRKEREKAVTKIEERLYKSYEKIRENAKNGLAVVLVKRGACGGCFNIVPPQRQADIREKKKLIVCEHCGRVMADVDDTPEEDQDKKTRRTRS
ncbi:zinc ribbon domain-containing protein [Penaeicola halotolerans]|uniref:zinc ribbon domain-containing protein n=1 Tax=Penaeicola halotolerans TaxID=2793196 RepID=UPI001CF8578D|nr:C4-type zinc ribbon domain-containing protein [Penaeicola halotolerans]